MFRVKQNSKLKMSKIYNKNFSRRSNNAWNVDLTSLLPWLSTHLKRHWKRNESREKIKWKTRHLTVLQMSLRLCSVRFLLCLIYSPDRSSSLKLHSYHQRGIFLSLSLSLSLHLVNDIAVNPSRSWPVLRYLFHIIFVMEVKWMKGEAKALAIDFHSFPIP